jgi:hypothetical protein
VVITARVERRIEPHSIVIGSLVDGYMRGKYSYLLRDVIEDRQPLVCGMPPTRPKAEWPDLI